MAKSLFAGMDLHSNNVMIGIVDQDGQRLKHQKLDCDLLRRRLSLVHQRTSLLLSFKSLYTRTTGQAMSLSRLKGMELA